MNRLSLVLAAVFVPVLASCAAVGERRPPAGTVDHIVLIWLQQPGDQAAIARIEATAADLARAIDGIVDLNVGRALASDRDVVDDSFDVALVMRFRDAAAMNAYLVHPVHVRAVTEVLQPLTARLLVYDVVAR
ncbi:MAG: Dabb family protein [Planctomycetes bacterium]|nr:Dabb family protein [Planctomycetota bacterium]